MKMLVERGRRPVNGKKKPNGNAKLSGFDLHQGRTEDE
jgi:hypothetical protein